MFLKHKPVRSKNGERDRVALVSLLTFFQSWLELLHQVYHISLYNMVSISVVSSWYVLLGSSRSSEELPLS